MCDSCGCSIESPFISIHGEGISVKVTGQEDLCPECVLTRVKRVMGLEDADPEEEAAEVYGVEA
jgi:hypothetical protein